MVAGKYVLFELLQFVPVNLFVVGGVFKFIQ